MTEPGGQSAARPVTIADGYPELRRIAHARVRGILIAIVRVNSIIAEGRLQWRVLPVQYRQRRRPIGARR